MKQTQAQIEAAARAVEEAYKCYGTEFTTIAICALTAAAEVGDDKSAYVEALNYAHAYERGSKEATAATIERCAQVADGCWTGEEAAIRIRALKDKP